MFRRLAESSHYDYPHLYPYPKRQKLLPVFAFLSAPEKPIHTCGEVPQNTNTLATGQQVP